MCFLLIRIICMFFKPNKSNIRTAWKEIQFNCIITLLKSQAAVFCKKALKSILPARTTQMTETVKQQLIMHRALGYVVL